MNKPIFLKNHIAVQSSRDLEQICQPLKRIGIDMFGYHRKYADGSELYLSNNSDWATYYYKNQILIKSKLIEIMNLNEFEYSIWPDDLPMTDETQMIHDSKVICNLNHGISLRFDGIDYCEFFGFLTKFNASYGTNLFLNNIDVLRKFSLHFKKIAFQIIKKCEHNKIIPAKKFIFDQNGLKNEQTYLKKFISSNKNYNALDQPTLSEREWQCAQYLMMGKNMRETALQLLISPRTVETHIENIKNKIGCNKKSDVISKLFKIDSARFTVDGNIL